VRLLAKCLVVGLLLLSACGAGLAAKTERTRLSDQEVASYVHTGGYNRDLVQQLTRAKDYLDLRVNLNSWQKQRKELAMVVAVDNTALAHEPRLKKLFVHLPMTGAELWETDEPVIWAFRAFYDYAKSKGVNIFFVTSRPASQREQTAHNLEREGYTGWRGLYMHSMASQEEEVTEKVRERGDIEKQGYSIILNIGSRLNDVKGEHSSKIVLLPEPDTHAPRSLQGLNSLG
jgi:predicted secreted acid phosphatase